MRADQVERQKRGLCIGCGRPVEPQRVGKTRCQRCSDRIVEGMRQRRAERASQGICVVCGRAPAVADVLTCESCRQAHVTRCKEQRRKAAHRC